MSESTTKKYIIMELEQDLIVKYDLSQLIYRLKCLLAGAGLTINTTEFDPIIATYIAERIEVAVMEHFLWSNEEENNLLEVEDDCAMLLEQLVVHARVVIEAVKEAALRAKLMDFARDLRKDTYRNFANVSRWGIWLYDKEYSINNQSICYRYENDSRLVELERLQDADKNKSEDRRAGYDDFELSDTLS